MKRTKEEKSQSYNDMHTWEVNDAFVWRMKDTDEVIQFEWSPMFMEYDMNV